MIKWFEDVSVSGAIPPWEKRGFRELIEHVREKPRPVFSIRVEQIEEDIL